MNQKLIYIPLPKNISFSVFEALKTHINYFKKLGYKILYLSRNKNLEDKNMIYFDSKIQLIQYLKIQKSGKIYSITVIETFIAYFSNLIGVKKEIIFWVQGLIDEEDFLTNNKKYRYFLFNFLLKKALNISDKIVVVTHTMKDILEKKYRLNSNKKTLFLNCNSRLSFTNLDKIPNSLCYIGGLSKWQNVDKILNFFNQLYQIDNKYKLYIATFNHKEAKNIIKNNVSKEANKNITLVSAKSKEEVEIFLNKMEFGFLIRDNILLNQVASPIKLAEYLSCGVNPIISDSLIEFTDLIKKYDCGIVLKNNNFRKGINEVINFKSKPKNALNLYNEYFEPKTLLNDIKKFLGED